MKYPAGLFALVLLLCLCACSGGGEAVDTAPPSTPAPSPSAPPGAGEGELDLLAEDLCLAAAGIPGEAELFTVDGVAVTARAYLYWLRHSTAYLEDSLAGYGMELDWEGDQQLAGYLKEDALNAAAQYALTQARAGELGYTLTQEQAGELAAALDYAKQAVGGEEAFREQLRRSGLDEETFYQLNAAPYYYELLKEGLFAGRPTDDEMDAYIEQEDVILAKHILLLTKDMATMESLGEEAAAQKEAAARDIAARLQASADPAADFEELLSQYGEDPGMAANPGGYAFTSEGYSYPDYGSQMVSEFTQGAAALEYGQVSGVVESAFGYHIILRLDPDTEELRGEYRAGLMARQLQAWIDEAEILLSEEYHALDVQAFYEAYRAYQQAFQSEAQQED